MALQPQGGDPLLAVAGLFLVALVVLLLAPAVAAAFHRSWRSGPVAGGRRFDLHNQHRGAECEECLDQPARILEER